MTCQDHSTQNDPLFPVRIGARTYLVATVHEGPHGWTWKAPSSESAARRIHRLATAPCRPTVRNFFGRCPEPLKVAQPPWRRRKPSLTTILNQAKKAGATSVMVDGVTIMLGPPSADSEANPWDKVFDAANKKRLT
jgi:hypothetical protein